MTGNLYVGGYVGKSDNTYLSNLKNSSTITGKAWVGGVAGYAGKLDTCENSGTLVIEGTYLDNDKNILSYVGGVAGYATSANNCTNNADISVKNAGNYVGGIAGYVYASRSDDATLFCNNKNKGNISGNDYVGGLFGSFAVNGDHSNLTLTVKSNTNEGTITGNDYVGGIIGYAQGESHNYYGRYTAYIKITDCTNSATITGNDYVGGIMGSSGDYMITDEVVWNTNTVTGTVTGQGENKGQLYGYLKV